MPSLTEVLRGTLLTPVSGYNPSGVGSACTLLQEKPPCVAQLSTPFTNLVFGIGFPLPPMTIATVGSIDADVADDVDGAAAEPPTAAWAAASSLPRAFEDAASAAA